MADMNQVLAKLVERTAENRVPWSKSFQPGMMRADFGNLSVHIAEGGEESERYVILTVIDRRGEIVGTLSHIPNSPNFNPSLITLFDDVTGIVAEDPRLDDLIEALDAVPPISRS